MKESEIKAARFQERGEPQRRWLMDKPSLRDIKKEATAQALAYAAFELARERGLDGFVVEDVVQRANYSRRTFANHFSCKEEAAASVVFAGIAEAEDLLADIPVGASLLDALQQIMRTQFTAELIWKVRELVSLSKRYPTLEPYILSVLRRLQIAAQETLSGLSNGRYTDGYIHLLIGAVYGSCFTIVDGSINVDLPGQATDDASAAVTLDQFLDTIFGYLRNGF